MWGPFRRKRDRRREAIEQAMDALENIRERFGQSKTGRGGGAYSNAVGLGMGILAVILMLSLVLAVSQNNRRSHL